MNAIMVRLQPVYDSNQRRERSRWKRGGEGREQKKGEGEIESSPITLQVLHKARMLLAPRSDDAFEGHRLAREREKKKGIIVSTHSTREFILHRSDRVEELGLDTSSLPHFHFHPTSTQKRASEEAKEKGGRGKKGERKHTWKYRQGTRPSGSPRCP